MITMLEFKLFHVFKMITRSKLMIEIIEIQGNLCEVSIALDGLPRQVVFRESVDSVETVQSKWQNLCISGIRQSQSH